MSAGASQTGGCTQCGRRAIISLDDVLLCVDCYAKFEGARYLFFQQNAAMMNLASAEMDRVIGMPGFSPKVDIPPMGPAVSNTISVVNSSVGAINTGTVKEIAVNLRSVHDHGAKSAHDALRNFTEALIKDQEIDAEKRNEILEQLAFLSSQAAAPAPDRKRSVVRSSLTAVRDTVATAGGLAAVWEAAEPVLKGFFGL